jgi:hypothetical protein
LNNSEKSFCNRWKNFFSVIFDAPVLFFFLCTGGLACANYFIKDNNIITAILSALMVLSGGITGAFFRKRWEELTEKPHLVAKGKMAIRNLKLLLSQIIYYESRLIIYIDRLKLVDPPDIRFIEYLEEIIDWCKLLQEVCLTSIENWEDIIPEASNLISMIGTFSELRITENNLKAQINLLTAQLSEVEKEKDETAEGKQQLEEELRNKEHELGKVTEQVQDLRKEIKRGVLGGITTTSTTLGTSTFGMSGLGMSPGSSGFSPQGALGLNPSALISTCQYCNKVFSPSIGSVLLGKSVCDDCRRQGKGLG